MYSPRGDDYKVHNVPEVSHVAVFVKDEPEGQDFCAHLDCENNHEYGL